MVNRLMHHILVFLFIIPTISIFAQKKEPTLVSDMKLNTSHFISKSLAHDSCNYTVSTVCEEGVSTNLEFAYNPENFVPRELVIAEVATGTWSVGAPSPISAIYEMLENGYDIVVIEYHIGDDYETDESIVRAEYYNVSGYPSLFFDGSNIEMGDPNVSILPELVSNYDTRMGKTTPIKLASNYYNTNDRNYVVDITVELKGEYINSQNFKLFAALTESNIEQEWIGLLDLDFVFRDMIPGPNGVAIGFSTDSVQSYAWNFSIDSTFKLENLELIVFVQNAITKEVMQGTIATLDTTTLFSPLNITGDKETFVNTDYTISWDVPNVSVNTLTGYNVYRQIGDAEFSLLVNTTDENFVDNISENGIIRYYITAVYDEGESVSSDTLVVDVLMSVKSLVYNNTSLYPNPANEFVKINSDYIIYSLSVYDYAGQQILFETVNDNFYRMNTSEFSEGIYLILINTEKGSATESVVID